MGTRVKRFIAAALRMSGMLRILENSDVQYAHALRVLCYHRIDEPEHRPYLAPNVLSATPGEFNKQIRFIGRNYNVIPVEQVIAAIERGQRLPPRAVLLTFDDGYRDFMETAWPTLKSMALPAVLFVSTSFLDNTAQPYWWDALYQIVTGAKGREIAVDGLGALQLTGEPSKQEAYHRLRRHLTGLGIAERASCLAALQKSTGIAPRRGDSVLNWDDVQAMSAEGLAVAPHTHTHAIMTRLTVADMASESKISRAQLRQHLGKDYPVFCYPNGRPGTFNLTTRRVLQDNGYVGAFTSLWGVTILGQTHPLEMRRISVGRPLTLDQLRYQLTGHYLRRRKRAGRL